MTHAGSQVTAEHGGFVCPELTALESSNIRQQQQKGIAFAAFHESTGGLIATAWEHCCLNLCRKEVKELANLTCISTILNDLLSKMQ